jgi:hypothetical protein
VKRQLLPKFSEADLARQVVRYFQDLHWTVYQEVQLHQGSHRADIVIAQNGRVGVIECKQALGLPVMEQAFEWVGYAHWVWVATWYNGRERSRLASRILKDYGIGHLSQSRRDIELNLPSEDVKPRLLRRPPYLDEMLSSLAPEQQTAAEAGTNRGGHWTPFRRTCYELSRVVRENPGLTLKEALSRFDHHYANTKSATSNLPEWIDKGKVPGVRLDRSDGKARLWTITDPAPKPPDP